MSVRGQIPVKMYVLTTVQCMSSNSSDYVTVKTQLSLVIKNHLGIGLLVIQRNVYWNDTRCGLIHRAYFLQTIIWKHFRKDLECSSEEFKETVMNIKLW